VSWDLAGISNKRAIRGELARLFITHKAPLGLSAKDDREIAARVRVHGNPPHDVRLGEKR